MLLSPTETPSKPFLVTSSGTSAAPVAPLTKPAAASSTVQDLAKSLYDGTNSDIPHIEAAAWLGDAGESRAAVLRAYMGLFDFSDFSILYSVRSLCEKLYMKGESQQLDRIIDAFAERWCTCNPNHKFRSVSIVYTLAYSIILLNTDAHSETNSGGRRMQRSQYVQSTLEAMKSLALEEAKTPKSHRRRK